MRCTRRNHSQKPQKQESQESINRKPYEEEVSGKIDAHLLPIVKALGLPRAAEFLMLFGGKYIHLSEHAIQDRNKVACLYGNDKTLALYENLIHAGYAKSYRVPTAKKFLARYLRSKGLKNADIAVRLSSTDVSVRGWLKSDQERRDASERSRSKQLESSIDEAVALGLVVRIDHSKSEAGCL